MDKIKLIVADTDAEFTKRFKNAMEGHGDIDLLGIFEDGALAYEKIQKLKPDAVVFDLVLPGLDGISLLREIARMKRPPMAICCSQFYSPVALEITRNCGASYFIYKPADFKCMYDTIKGCYISFAQMRSMRLNDQQESRPDGLEIHNYLVSLGIPSRLIGCSYLAEAVRLALKDISLTQNLSKGLYLEIARTMNTTPVCIERCIRNAIGTAYQSGKLGDRMMTCPSNKEFINYVLRTMES